MQKETMVLADCDGTVHSRLIQGPAKVYGKGKEREKKGKRNSQRDDEME